MFHLVVKKKSKATLISILTPRENTKTEGGQRGTGPSADRGEKPLTAATSPHIKGEKRHQTGGVGWTGQNGVQEGGI